MNIADRIAEIKTGDIGNSMKRVLLVEGVDDKNALSIFLTKKFPAWEQKWVLASADKKDHVLKILTKESNWLGLVDRDEWTETEIQTQTTRLQNLVILPRFCLESYLVEPNELWSALPLKQRDKIIGGLPKLIEEIRAEKSTWLRHAALWYVINPLWRELRALGFNNEVLQPEDVPDDATLKAKLSAWHNAINSEYILQKVHETISAFQQETDFIFYTQRLYAKKFYPLVIHPTLNRLLQVQISEKEQRKDIFSELFVPSDLNVLWQKMELL